MPQKHPFPRPSCKMTAAQKKWGSRKAKKKKHLESSQGMVEKAQLSLAISKAHNFTKPICRFLKGDLDGTTLSYATNLRHDVGPFTRARLFTYDIMNIASDLRKKWRTCESCCLLLWVFCARERERGEGKEKLGRGNGCGEDRRKVLSGS